MIIFIYGENTFLSRRYLRDQVEKFKKTRDPQGYNVVFLDGQKEQAGRLLTEIVSLPFLAEKRMIIVENVLSISDKELLGALIGCVKEHKIPESNVVVFWQGEPLSKVKEAKDLKELLAQEKYVREFSMLGGVKLTAWIKKEVESQGGKINADALQYLCQNCRDDMWYLYSLISQLVAYTSRVLPPPPSVPPSRVPTKVEDPRFSKIGTGGEAKAPSPLEGEGKGEVVRAITLSDTQLFVEEKIDDNIFTMVDAIVGGNFQQAFKLLREQRRQGQEEAYLFGMILRQFRILLEMRDLIDREDNITSDALAKKLALHPFVAKKSWPLVKRYPLNKLKSAYDRLLDVDIKTKTGFADQSLLIDLFVAKSAL